MECEININKFYIEDAEILNILSNGNIKYINMRYTLDRDNSYVISVVRHTNEVLSKYWNRVNYSRRIFIRTPYFLKKFSGNKVQYYIDNISPIDDEIFRIKPIGFDFIDKKINKKNVNIPYILDSGIFIFPMDYVINYVGNKIMICKLSFDRIDFSMLKIGIMHCYIAPYRCHFTSKLKKYDNKMSTGKVVKIVDLVNSIDKNLSDFIYHETVVDHGCPYGIIVFKEDINNDGE
jgi:hypothetical protein